jgi:hypothetical protein
MEQNNVASVATRAVPVTWMPVFIMILTFLPISFRCPPNVNHYPSESGTIVMPDYRCLIGKNCLKKRHL